MRDVRITRLLVRAANHSDCAHACRYCPLTRKQSPIDLSRYVAVVQRVRNWAAEQSEPLKISHLLGYHWNYEGPDLDALRRLDGDLALPGITLGGLPSRTNDELESWLALLQRYGLRTVHATFGGCGDVHDRWNNQKGNFALLMRTLHVARSLPGNLRLGQRILVGRSTLCSLELLIQQLSSLSSLEGDWLYAMPFFYQSERQKLQAHVEQDRIDERIRAKLPSSIKPLFDRNDRNLSEREWIERLEVGRPAPDEATLILRLSAKTIDELEQRSIEDIVEKLSTAVRTAYIAMPSHDELMSRYGDRSNTNIYSTARCVEMKWLDAYRREHPHIALDQSVTHCWFGG